ncbi:MULTISPECIES: TetR family transcriptional regulator [unclassified Actinobaculum]|uniref:TetR/AcrR family transcriptional regulator n=1 Tax=unclassified Actinobaculum TaxID=2609299 RepID=UPI000D527875|nr:MULTISPECIES: TetR family transcriptional regulator [unclassified Actinobaculum]AWE42252.1 TetR family transcriptional regulator [Actinobaculum sp. 313]RTE50822.1 TetR family transcriptional regulator [Actinobaculum sp. 352]
MSDRRRQIADAGIHILSARGARALTHLNVDRELGLANGSTSYYARTRRDLIKLVVERLAERTVEELSVEVATAAWNVEDERSVAARVATGLARSARRTEDHRARILLLMECRSDPELYDALLRGTSVREHFSREVLPFLQSLNVADVEERAADLAALVDALLMQRVIRNAPVDEELIIYSFLSGLSRVTSAD